MFGMCEAKNGTETDELLQAGADGHQRVWQNAEENSKSLKTVGSQQRKQETVGSKDKRKESRERSIRGL